MAGPRIEIKDSLGQRTIVLDKPTFTIGRRSTCDLHLMDTDVSREHAEIADVGGTYVVRDRGSRFGTFVNGTQVTEQRIGHGDRIRLGRTGGAELLFLLTDDPVDSSSVSGSSIILGFRQVSALLESLRALGIRHVMCVPLRIVRFVDRASDAADERAIGVLYLDSREKGTLASKTAQAALETLAGEAAVAIENARLYRETLEKTRIEQELRIASQIQHELLPPPRKTADFFEAVGTSIPCREIGGDFFDYLDLEEGRFGFALGDVAGKGAPAALLTAVLQGIFTGQSSSVQEPGLTMTRVNKGLLARSVEARFATAFFGVLHPNGLLEYCNAGHNPPMLFSKSGVRRLEAGGIVLGLFANAVYEQDAVHLDPGDTIVVFSDGVSEALDTAGEEFGDDRLQDAVVAKLAEQPQDVLDGLLATVRKFAGGAAQNDDMTALVVRYTAPPATN